MLARGDALHTRTLTVGEVPLKPLETNHRELPDRYLSCFNRPGIQALPFDLKAVSLYAPTRQDRSIRRPAAMQLACATAAGLDLFVTNGERLSRKVVAGVNFICGLDRAPS